MTSTSQVEVLEYIDTSTRFGEEMGYAVNASTSFDLFMAEVRKIQLLKPSEEGELAKKIEAGVYAQHLIDSDPLITGQLLAELTEVAKEGVEAKKRFIEGNIRLVISIAKKYIASGIEIGELIHDGTLGLIRAVEKFDYKAGIKFSTYATYWIRQFIYRKKPDYMHIVHLPPNVTNALHKLRAVTKELEDSRGYTPTDEDLAEKIGVTVGEVKKFKSYNRPWLSFQYSNSFDDGDSRDSIEGCLIPDSGPTPDEVVVSSGLESAISGALGKLSSKQRLVVEWRFGILDGVERSYREISELLSIPQGVVRRTLVTALQSISDNDRSVLSEYYACG